MVIFKVKLCKVWIIKLFLKLFLGKDNFFKYCLLIWVLILVVVEWVKVIIINWWWLCNW